MKAHINFKKACEIFNTVYVLVSQNPDKEKNDIIKNINDVIKKTANLKNIKVLTGFQGQLTALVAKQLNIKYLIRSIEIISIINLKLI
ncbi:hypothetical protein [Mycoplasmopsis cynos]|uniref:hypothetical protein n=1 Tax=Mycoplasmopsis cynos TaxID=171284 RepID=UPI0024C8CDD0|nr:hypothetical protein [Mycoplasmopsis cynos]WAM07442.1 hypothetical protein ONA21_04690 [Mycoplasmopsis cynos]